MYENHCARLQPGQKRSLDNFIQQCRKLVVKYSCNEVTLVVGLFASIEVFCDLPPAGIGCHGDKESVIQYAIEIVDLKPKHASEKCAISRETDNDLKIRMIHRGRTHVEGLEMMDCCHATIQDSRWSTILVCHMAIEEDIAAEVNNNVTLMRLRALHAAEDNGTNFKSLGLVVLSSILSKWIDVLVAVDLQSDILRETEDLELMMVKDSQYGGWKQISAGFAPTDVKESALLYWRMDPQNLRASVDLGEDTSRPSQIDNSGKRATLLFQGLAERLQWPNAKLCMRDRQQLEGQGSDRLRHQEEVIDMLLVKMGQQQDMDHLCLAEQPAIHGDVAVLVVRL
ncbi:hypothetical protein BCR39DRAFT_508315 [Naematelia encephala]|uniref:Uncharacterized protein n=1 Tax=Naematelia encephala TaxID=71784 RepID=A0A1Y2AHC4_9TREE|nr:hypothetical protein BCR39DRAFT_508315 [Naematelia encephala]